MPVDEKEQQSAGKRPLRDDEKLLKQIRDDFKYHKEYWEKNYEESAKDADCAAAIPPTDFKKDRKDRPCIWPDEVSQYIKQFNNNLRLNKRSGNVRPKGDATKKDAEHRQAYMYGIEDASRAQSIYTTAAESCGEVGFGAWRVTYVVTGPNGEKEPRLKRIANWSTVYWDPDAEMADFSDQNRCFVIDTMRETTFARKYKNAKKKSFSDSDKEVASGWFAGENLTIAEYWTRDEYEEDGQKRYKVTQYITNGLEILEENEWIGSWIPIIGVFGEEKYVKEGGQWKRMFMGLIRRARAPQQMLAYTASQHAEDLGMTPRAPLAGWEGMFDEELHKYIHREPRGYVAFKIPSQDVWPVAWGPPPLPQRSQFAPNPEVYEMSYERWRRSIQACMGSAPLPTAAQRLNEKSGKALEKIQNEQAIGSFHITDNFKRALENSGRQINELITKLAELDSLPQQLLGKNQKDEDVTIKVASRQKAAQKPNSEHLPEADFFFAHRGQFEYTISDGPNFQSQREEQSDFADTMIGNLPKLGLPPALTQQVLAISIKLKNIGALGDEIADLLSPPDPQNLPPQAKAILAQSQGQIQMLQQEIQKLQLEKLGKVTEIQGKTQIEREKLAVQMSEADKDRENKALIAEIMTKAQALNERMTLLGDMMQQWHKQAHEMGMMMQEHQHAKELAANSAAAASAQSAQEAGQTSAQSAQDASQHAAMQPEQASPEQ